MSRPSPPSVSARGRSIARRLLTLLLACCVLGMTTPCRADTATAVYDDIKDVLTRLVERRASEDAARFVRRSSVGLGFYLTRSLEHVRRGQWGALGQSLRRDFADMAADYVYWELINAKKLGPFRRPSDRTRPFKTFLDCFDSPTNGEAAPPRQLCEPLRAQLVRAEGLHRATLVYQDCQAMEPKRKSGHEFSCDVAHLVRAAMLENVEEAQQYAIEVLSAAGAFTIPNLDDRLPHSGGESNQPLRTLLQQSLDDSAHRSQTAWPTKAEPGSALYGSLHACRFRSLSALMHAVLDARVPEGELNLAAACLNARMPAPLLATFIDQIPLFPTYTVVVPPEELLTALQNRPPSPQRFWLTSQAVVRFECRADDPQQPELATCALSGQPWERFALADVVRVASAINALETRVLSSNAVGETVLCSGNCPFQALELAARFAALREQVRHLSEQRTLSSVALEVERGLRIVADIDPLPEGSVLDCVRLMVPNPKDDSDIPDILRAALTGSRAELATFALRSAFDDTLENGGGGALDPLLADLVVTMTQFELDDPRPDSASISRDALRAAGIRLLDGFRSQEGFQRQGLSIRPVATLRISWNQTYLNQRGDNGLRYVPSLDWPVERVRMSAATSLQFTIFDGLAPFSEVAARTQGGYEHESLLLLDALRPRLNLLVGFPELDNNIAASIGMAFRTITAQKKDAAQDPDGTHFEYQPTLRNGQDISQALEVNLGIAYVF